MQVLRHGRSHPCPEPARHHDGCEVVR
jgi:hypothetical protein